MNDNYIVIKIAAGVVLGLLVWTAIARYQKQKAIERGLEELRQAMNDPDPLGWRARSKGQPAPASRPRADSIKPVSPGFRCEQRTLLKRVSGGWIQVAPGTTSGTARTVVAKTTATRYRRNRLAVGK